MHRYYLLLAGDYYYPEDGTGNWINTFEIEEEAKNVIKEIQDPPEVFQQGPRKGQIKPNQKLRSYYEIGDRKYDWYEIIDLKDWILKGRN